MLNRIKKVNKGFFNISVIDQMPYKLYSAPINKIGLSVNVWVSVLYLTRSVSCVAYSTPCTYRSGHLNFSLKNKEFLKKLLWSNMYTALIGAWGAYGSRAESHIFYPFMSSLSGRRHAIVRPITTFATG